MICRAWGTFVEPIGFMASFRIPVAGMLFFLLLSCSNTRVLDTPDIPPGGDSSYKWSPVQHDFSSDDYTVEVFGYRSYFDSLVKPIRADSFITFGIIIPYSGVVVRGRESIMRFGNDSVFCAISYTYIQMREEMSSSSLLMDILIPPSTNQTWEDQHHMSVTPVGVILEGTVRLMPGISFYFEHFRKSEFSSDSSGVSGHLYYGTDSFTVRTSYNPTPLYATNGKGWHLTQGYSLSKSDTVVAFLQHQPPPKQDHWATGSKYIYLSTGLSPELKMVISGFLSVVSKVLILAGMQFFY